MHILKLIIFLCIYNIILSNDCIYVNYKHEDFNDKVCSLAIQDANTYHGNTEIYFALGFFTGPVGLMYSSFKTHRISTKNIYLSNNQDLLEDDLYIKCYLKTAKKNSIKYTVFGWISSTVLIIILLILIRRT